MYVWQLDGVFPPKVGSNERGEWGEFVDGR